MLSINDFFKCEATLNRLRNCGCLSSHPDPFAEWMADHQFPAATLQGHVSGIAHFSHSLKGEEPEMRDIDRHARIFPGEHLPECECRGWRKGSSAKCASCPISRFEKYLSDRRGMDFNTGNFAYTRIHDEHLLWLGEIRGLESSSIGPRSDCLSRFLGWYEKSSNRKDLKELAPREVESFFLEATSGWGNAFKRSLQGTLRGFFDFRREKGHTPRNLRFSVPVIKTYRLSEVPGKIEDGEAARLPESVDRSTGSGKRTCAIPRIPYAYGVRGCQIRALKMKGIDWRKEEIHFPAVKGGKSCSFPLTGEVGNALLGYLRNVGKTSRRSELFLTLRAPCRPLAGSSTLSRIVAAAMAGAGIDSPGGGCHCFRHGFASRMLEQGESFRHIAGLMGHRHIRTTFVHTKIDFDSPAEVALEPPEVEYENDWFPELPGGRNDAFRRAQTAFRFRLPQFRHAAASVRPSSARDGFRRQSAYRSCLPELFRHHGP
ncbi:MAG: tyrosine-type recombinase/integrase, partial [Proteobacteria bacterium]|nr:tyrosine-type recombinase/integrase [Pseudomonadota bacterium]